MKELLREIRACDLCREHLPLGPRPIVAASKESRVVIIGQAPGRKVHESGVPWDDPSGDQLRRWMGVGKETFYDPAAIAIVPMGFCYPGKGPRKGGGGDLPPRPECAPLWHGPLLGALQEVRLTLVIGQYAQGRYLAESKKRNLTETVRGFESYLESSLFPLPHPSPRNRFWMAKNPWFEQQVVPRLQAEVEAALGSKRS